MLYTDNLGVSRRIRPYGNNQILIVCKRDDGMGQNGLFLSPIDDSFPITQGFVAELPDDRRFLVREHLHFKLGDHVLFNRYANWEVVEDHYYSEELQMPVYDTIYTISVLDIIAIVEGKAA